MNQIATATDFNNLIPQLQGKYSDILKQCAQLGLSCRCEMAGGRDFLIVIGPGLSSANWWLNKLNIDE